MKLLLAIMAVAAAWLWLRSAFSEAIHGNEPLDRGKLLVRGTVLLVATVVLVVSIASTLGTIVGLVVCAAVTALVARRVREAITVTTEKRGD